MGKGIRQFSRFEEKIIFCPQPAQIFIRVIQDPFKLKIEKWEEKKSGMRNGRYKCAHLRLSASIFFSQINADLFLANFRRKMEMIGYLKSFHHCIANHIF
jgi:hypothetical protein